MAHAFEKQTASRPNIYQTITITSPIKTQCTAKFGNSTQQVRVVTSIGGYVSIDNSTSTTQVTSTTIPASGFFVPASVASAEYFVVTPGQVLTFCTTGLTTGYVSVTEMA